MWCVCDRLIAELRRDPAPLPTALAFKLNVALRFGDGFAPGFLQFPSVHCGCGGIYYQPDWALLLLLSMDILVDGFHREYQISFFTAAAVHR